MFNQHNIGMNESLVDNEGFPRNDIDVYTVRQARNKVLSKLLKMLIVPYHLFNHFN